MTDALDLRPDADLHDLLDGFDRSVLAAVAALREAAGTETEGLRRLVGTAAEAHRRAMEVHGFDRGLDEPPRPPVALWDALTAYRTEMETVHAAFREGLRDLDLGAALGRRYEEAAEALAAKGAQAPEVIVRPEPEDLIEAQAGDSTTLLARKLAERTRRSARALGRTLSNGARRVVGKEPRAPEPPVQAVPLRALLEEQTRVRIPRLLVADHTTVQTDVGQAVARLEGAFTVWAGDLLRLESGLDRPRFHTADALAWPAAKTEDRGQRAEDGGQRTERSWQRYPSRPTPPSAALRAGSGAGHASPEEWLSAEPPPLDTPEATASTDAAVPDPAAADPAADSSVPDPAEERAKVRRVREAVQALDAALHAASVSLPPPDASDLDAARDALAERVRRSGYDSDRHAAPGEAEPLAELANDVARWSGWHRNVVRRLGVDGLLLELRGRLVEEVDGLVDGVAERVVLPVQTMVRSVAYRLAQLRAEATEACDRIAEPAPLAEALRDLLGRALAVIDREMRPALQQVSLDRAVEEAVAAMRTRLAEIVRPLPERVTLHSRLGPDQAGRPGSAAEVELRAIVQSLLGEEFAARLVRSADALRQPVLTALAQAETVRDIVRFNLETAIEELEAAQGEATGEPVEDEETDVLANARELTVDGLARAEERLAGIGTPLAGPWRAFVRRAVETFEGSWTALHERANAENLVAAGLLDLKARTNRTVERLRLQAEALGKRTAFALRTWFRFGRIKAKRLVEMGQQAAGLAEQSALDRRRTLDALAEAATLDAGLPLVYRRLFSFAPLSDPTLFVGRALELARLGEQVERRRAGRDTSPVVVTSEPGGGRTSLLNVLQATAFRDDAPARLALTERVETEAVLAARLGEALALEGPVPSLDALAARLLADDFDARPVCFIEGLEHLMLRAPGGLDLIERTLICLSRTDTRVLWVCTAVLPGWQFVERTVPQVGGLVDVVALPPLTRDEVEAALTKRHARSGLPLIFAEPPEPSALLARRLNKAETPEARQALLRGEFFDGLHRAGGAGLRLSLLYWLRAADFKAAADTLTLHPVRPLDFSFIGTFDLPRLFALRALLQHGTLTLAEYERAVRTTREESLLTFESLHNLRLLQRADGPEAALSPRRNGQAAEMPVEDGVRYRLHPLVVAPVTAALRARNML